MTDKIKFTVGGERHDLPIDGSKTLRVGSVSPSIKLTVERSMTTEEKAQALVDKVRSEYPLVADFHVTSIALMRTIEQHEAFRQEVSDAVTALLDVFKGDSLSQGVINGHLHQFILPTPKPDPLVEIISEINAGPYIKTRAEYADAIRAALDALGFEIREKNDG